MERKNKRELLQHIEEQNKSLQKYKSRLHDVVESYKNLIKEKEALEQSITVLTEPNLEATVASNPLAVETESTSVKNECTELPEGEVTYNLNQLKNNLRTLTLEKARIENELKTDRKRLLRENEELQKQMANNESQWMEEKTKLETLVKELKKQIREQQNDRDKEQQNHALMLKELQSLVAEERSAKEKLEQQLENLKLALEKLPDKRHEYERHINELRNELKSTQNLLQAAEGEKKDLPSLLKQLQQEMNEMKGRHQEAVDREVRRANEAEDKLKALAAISEERAASLEHRLSELSQMVGSYDKLRQQDQIAIQKLKERVAQLDQENTALARTVTGSEKSFDFENDANLDAQTIVERISKLKSYLRATNQMPKKFTSISGTMAEIQKDESNIHAHCQKELMQLREELNRCKINQQLAKNESVSEEESNSEITSLKKQITNLQNELQLCKVQQKSAQQRLQTNEQNFHSCIAEMMSRHKQELSAQHHEYQVKLLELELQLQKQRERSLLLLEDKEKEINLLKLKVPVCNRMEKVDLREADPSMSVNQESVQSYNETDHLSDLISTSVTSQKKGRQILHYAEEMCRKDVEISNLRRSKAQVEGTLRELQQISALKDEKYQNEIDIMKSQMKRLESVEKGVNMEYLKNVVLRFIKCSKRSDQSHMLNAIASILHFTVLELEEARGFLHLL